MIQQHRNFANRDLANGLRIMRRNKQSAQAQNISISPVCPYLRFPLAAARSIHSEIKPSYGVSLKALSRHEEIRILGPRKTRPPSDLEYSTNVCFPIYLTLVWSPCLRKLITKSSLMRHLKTTAVAPSIADISGTEDSTLPPNFWCWKFFPLAARLLPLPDGPMASAASAI